MIAAEPITPLFVCRSCGGLPDCAYKVSAEIGHRWIIACGHCDRRVASAVSYEDAMTQWNDGDMPPAQRVIAKLKFSHNRNAAWHMGKKAKEAAQ